MRFIKLVVINVALALFTLACGGTTTVTTPTPSPSASPVAASTPTPDPMAATREIYTDKCESCHQENGEGGVVKIEGKRLNVPSFSKGHALGHTDEEFTKQISVGGDGMPAFKDKLKPEEIESLITYIRKSFQSGGGASSSVTTASPSVTTATPKSR